MTTQSTYTATSSTGQTFSITTARSIEFAVITRVIDPQGGMVRGGVAEAFGTEAMVTTGKLSTCEKTVKMFAGLKYSCEIVPLAR